MDTPFNILDLLDESQLKDRGIVKWGYTQNPLAQSFDSYRSWVERGDHGPLGYLSDSRMEKRRDLRNYYPEFSSALVFLFSYASVKKSLESFYRSSESNGLHMAGYVFGFEGEDYHHVIKERLASLATEVSKLHPETPEWQLTLDVHPVLERDLAWRAGLGWFGKNSMLINTQEGSYTLIGSILFNKKLGAETSDKVETDHCGSCRACVDACPTDAIDEQKRQLIAQRCISTFTIELFKESAEIPGHKNLSQGEIFGCDICQEVCPWNIKLLNKISPKKIDAAQSLELISFFLSSPLESILKKLSEMSNKAYVRMFKKTTLARTGRKGMFKNLLVFKK